jgi:Tol biopolymer transport system component
MAAVALIAVALLVFAAGLDVFRARAPHASPAVARFEIPAPPGTVFNPSASHPAVSPDGRAIAFLASRDGEESRIWVRRLDATVAHELPGTAAGFAPFWSPDSRFVAFFAKGALKKVGVSGEPVQVLCDVPTRVTLSGNWHANGVILFTGADGIYRTSANGGAATRVTAIRSDLGENAHSLPQFLPDGRHFVYNARLTAEGTFENWVVLRSLDVADDRRLFSAGSQALFAGPDELLFVRNGALYVQRLDPAHLAPAGDPKIIGTAGPVGENPSTPRGMFGVSVDPANAVLAYLTVPAAEFAWFDRRGVPLGRFGEIGDRTPAISHDGRHVAVSRLDAARGTRTIWILDVNHPDVASQVSNGRWDGCPAWAPDDEAIVFASGPPGGQEIVEKNVGATASASRAIAQHVKGCPLEWSSDGAYVLYNSGNAVPAAAAALWLLPVGQADPPRSIDGTTPDGPRGAQGRVSPNGRWLAFEGDGAAGREIYVRALSGSPGRRWQVSTQGGIEPQWSADGRELFFVGRDKRLMSAPVSTDGAFQVGTPAPLFLTNLDANGIPITGRNQYVVTPNGEHFLMKYTPPDAPSAAITVVLNWRELPR